MIQINFYEVDCLPERERVKRKKLERELNKFLKMNVRYAKVNEGYEYSNTVSARSCICAAISNYKLPVKVHLINGVVYLERTDM